MTGAQRPTEQVVPIHAGLPCPFCGGQPIIEPWHGGGPRKRMVHCAAEDCAVNPQVSGATSAKALKKWNRREPRKVWGDE